jgi:hypothetical protein
MEAQMDNARAHRETAQMAEYIRAHGIEARIVDPGQIEAVEVYTIDGTPGSEIVTLPADLEAVRAWLGY